MATTGEFLQQLRPNGPWILVAIHPNSGAIEGVAVRDADGVAAFLGRHLGQRNCYYSMNPTRGPMDKKPTKKDIAAIEFICTDLDPKADETAEAGKTRYLETLRT